jgi:hypothetical protein
MQTGQPCSQVELLSLHCPYQLLSLHLLLQLLLPLLQHARQLPRAAVCSQVLPHELVTAAHQRVQLLAAQHTWCAQHRCELLTKRLQVQH